MRMCKFWRVVRFRIGHIFIKTHLTVNLFWYLISFWLIISIRYRSFLIRLLCWYLIIQVYSNCGTVFFVHSWFGKLGWMELLVFWDLAYCVGFDWLWTQIFRKIRHHNLEIRRFIHRLKIWSFLWCEFGRITVYLWAIIVKNLIYGLFGYCISEFGRLIWNWFLFYLDIVLYRFHTFCLRNIFLWWAHFDIWYHKNWIKIICQVVYWKWVYI